MLSRKSVFLLAVLVGLFLSGMAFADMMPVARSDMEPDRLLGESSRTSLDHTSALSTLSPGLYVNSITDPDLGTVGCLADVVEVDRQTADTQVVQYMAEGASSFNLCVYGLLGFGVFRCVPWMKRGFLGIAPEWYHDGGPHQIGRSYAVLPGSQLSLQAYCFIQPVCVVETLSLQFLRMGTLESLFRKSQSRTSNLAYRGPPSLT